MKVGKMVERWRPRDFAAVVGQPEVVAWCQVRQAQNDPQNVIFHGPSGSGKNSVARLHARFLACTSPAPGGLACGSCEACRTPIDEKPNGFYVEVSCAQTN